MYDNCLCLAGGAREGGERAELKIVDGAVDGDGERASVGTKRRGGAGVVRVVGGVKDEWWWGSNLLALALALKGIRKKQRKKTQETPMKTQVLCFYSSHA
jgi:hypothetical protein